MIGAQSPSWSIAGAAARHKHCGGKTCRRPNWYVQVCGQAFVSATERDCWSGYGARRVYLIITAEDGIVEYELDHMRND